MKTKKKTGSKEVRKVDEDYKRQFSRNQIQPHRPRGSLSSFPRETSESHTVLEHGESGLEWCVASLIPRQCVRWRDGF